MRLVMLDAMEFRSNLVRRGIKGLRERFGDAHKASQHFGSFAGKARHLQGVHKFRSEARPGIAGNRDMVNLGKRDAGSVQAVADGRGRKSRGVFNAVEAFFLHGGNQAAIRDQCRRRITVIRINSQYMHQIFSVRKSSRLASYAAVWNQDRELEPPLATATGRTATASELAPV